MNSLGLEESFIPPDFSEKDITDLKKYFEFHDRYRETISQQLIDRIRDHPLWKPVLSQMTPEQLKAQSEHSRKLQREAIFENKWKEYFDNLVAQGRSYARLNIRYNEWYELVTMVKVILLPYIKKDYAHSLEEALDIVDGMSKFIDYAMYAIAEAYFLEKNEIIRAGEERFRIIFQNSKDVIFLIDQEGKMLEINHSALYKKEDIIGKSIYDFQPSENAPILQGALQSAFENKTPAYFETDIPVNGGKKYYSSTISPIIDNNGKVSTAVVVSRDITRQKEAEIELTRLNLSLENKVSERTEELKIINKELESFTYSVSHDLRAPLRAINGFSEILKEEYAGQLNEDARDLLSEITGNVKKMGQLIDNLLEFSRLGKQNISRAVVNMTELFNSVAEDLKKTADRNISISIGKLNEANGDRSMLKQVAFNLVSNAIKYSSKKPNPRIEIGSVQEDGSNTYFVKDNGAGFDMRYYDKLFGVFQRLHGSGEFEGTGVGLAIVQRIVSKHAGRVWAEGKEGEGATFYFSLPNQQNNR